MSQAGLHYDRYQHQGANEWMMRIGDTAAPPILFVPPLFEEMNRTRALLAGVMRRLAAKGFGCWLIDLPGTGESERELEEVSLDEWREAVVAAVAHIHSAASRKPVLAAVRGGCLIDDGPLVPGRWRFAPVEGASLARDMVRAGLAGGAEWAGYAASPGLRAALETASVAPVAKLRTVRLATDAGAADAKISGPALWRRSEPGTSNELADALATDLAAWSTQCAGS